MYMKTNMDHFLDSVKEEVMKVNNEIIQDDDEKITCDNCNLEYHEDDIRKMSSFGYRDSFNSMEGHYQERRYTGEENVCEECSTNERYRENF